MIRRGFCVLVVCCLLMWVRTCVGGRGEEEAAVRGVVERGGEGRGVVEEQSLVWLYMGRGKGAW